MMARWRSCNTTPFNLIGLLSTETFSPRIRIENAIAGCGVQRSVLGFSRVACLFCLVRGRVIDVHFLVSMCEFWGTVV